MPVKTTNAAPAPKTPFLTFWHEWEGSDKYLVWYAFRTEAANKQTSAMKKNTLEYECNEKISENGK